ncbi:MAG TPA: response regulator [Candidatus Saccharimonadia bacterium]|nr:response regulator [Candidatus Saccharimonadia bacterium]
MKLIAGWLLASLWPALAMPAAADPAPQSERGRVPVDTYPASVHDGGPGNFRAQILPDDRLAIANGQGLLLFDGARWRMHPHPERRAPLYELAYTADGRFYAGFPNDIGYFEPDGRGGYGWVGLSHHLEPELRSFGVVLATLHDARRDRIVFVSTTIAFVLSRDRPERVTVLRPAGAFTGARMVDEEICLHDTGSGVARIAGGEAPVLDPVAGTSGLPGIPAGIAPIAGGYLIMLSNGQLHRSNGGALVPVGTSNWEHWRSASPSFFARLRDGNFAIGFRRSPPWIIDAEGAVVERYDELAGLPGVAPQGFAEDRMGGLWVSQANNIWRIGRGSALTMFGQGEGVPRTERLERWRGRLYLTSADSLSRLVPAPAGQSARFELVPATTLSKAWAVEAIEDRLVVVGNGIFQTGHHDTELQRVLELGQLTSFDVSAYRKGLAYAGTDGGVFEVDFSNPLPTARLIPGSPTTVDNAVEVAADTLWLASRAGDLWQTRRRSGAWDAPIRRGREIGLPPGPHKPNVGNAGRIWMATNEGVFVRDAGRERFVRPEGLPRELIERPIASVSEDADGNLWVQTSTGAGVAWKQGAKWRWDGSLLLPLDSSAVMLGVAREDNIAWVLRSDGLARIDLAARAPPGAPVLPRVVRIEDLRARTELPLQPHSQLGVKQRDLRLRFALPAFERPLLNRMRSRLEGYESKWSEWSSRTEREFTNLPDGDFRLELQARDAFGRVSTAVPLRLSFPAPWWRSTWAHAAYAASAALLLWLATRLGARRRVMLLHARQRELEAVVEQRTRELKQSNERLADQTERLTEVDRLKTRFFINVGHEFRTPLTLVLGPIDDLLRDARERLSARAREQLEMANRNARRVLDLIVELLDVNRFEHGQMRLTRVPTDLRALAQRVLFDHAALLERHGHRSSFNVISEGPWLAAVDPPQIERALGNLIGNAAKYMARGGAIELRLRRTDGVIELALVDQGRGISAAALPHVYDRFFQADSTDGAGGYGIGLALVREIVEAHQGSAGVESELGTGSTFLLTLPALDADTASPPATAVCDLAPDSEQEQEHEGEDEIADGHALAPRRGCPLVLVVDDHDDLRARVRALLEARFDVIEAANGPHAWIQARERLPDLIVCDVMMPGFDGTELTRRLRADPETAAIAVLLLTAKVGSEHAVAGLQAGADDYLSKPFDASELLARIDALLARAHRLRLRLLRERTAPPAAAVAESADMRWRRRLDELIAQRLDEPALGVEQLADEMHADRSQLFRKCKELFGVSPSEHLRNARLERAHGLLEARVGSVSEIAYAVGYDSLSSFTRAFKARYALPPSQVAVRKAG